MVSPVAVAYQVAGAAPRVAGGSVWFMVADPVRVQDGDPVLVRRAPAFYAVVHRASATELAVMPCNPAVPDRRVRVSEVAAVYRNIGAPSPPPRRLRPSPQLRIDGTT